MRFQAVVAVVAASLIGFAPVLASEESVPVNGAFEHVGADGLPHGWTTAIGASVANSGKTSEISVVAAPDGTGKCVRLVSTPDTRRWQSLRRGVSVSPGSLISLRLRARSRGIDWAGARWVNAVGALFYEDADGGRVGFLATPTLSGDNDWTELRAYGVVPSRADRAFAQVFLTMAGELWVDDVEVVSTPLDPWSQGAREALVEALAWHLSRTYSYLGYEGRAPADALTTDREALLAAETHDAFVDALITWLARFRDPHVWVKRDGRVIGPMNTLPPPAWNIQGTLRTLAGWEKVAHGRNVLALRDGARGYLLVATFAMRDDDRAALTAALDGLRDVEQLVIDVRANAGGNEELARTVLAPFADEDTPYARQRVRDPASGDAESFIDTGVRILAAAPEDRRSAARVVVLQGPHCMSSSEGFLLMAKALPRVTTMGRPSVGASGNPQPFALLPGLEVWSSTWRSYDLEGNCLEGVGVAPDVPLEPGPEAEWATRDRLLEQALELLGE